MCDDEAMKEAVRQFKVAYDELGSYYIKDEGAKVEAVKCIVMMAKDVGRGQKDQARKEMLDKFEKENRAKAPEKPQDAPKKEQTTSAPPKAPDTTEPKGVTVVQWAKGEDGKTLDFDPVQKKWHHCPGCGNENINWKGKEGQSDYQACFDCHLWLITSGKASWFKDVPGRTEKAVPETDAQKAKKAQTQAQAQADGQKTL